MKKSYLRALAAEAERNRYEAASQSQALADEVRRLKAELEAVKINWRPVPITHEWQPKNPQCALCDEPRDAARHQVGG
jgi:hypothetical protein